MGSFFEGFTIDKLLAATQAFNQQRIDNRMQELRAQAYLNSIPARSGNPNASSNPASQTEADGWLKRHGLTLALVAVAGVVAWKVLK